MIIIYDKDINDILSQILKDQSKILDIINLDNNSEDGDKELKVKKNTPEKILEEYKDYLYLDGKSDNTILSYYYAVKNYIRWLEKKSVLFVGEIFRVNVVDYRRYLLGSNYSIGSINNYISCLGSFNNFLIDQHYQSDVVVSPSRDIIKIAKGSEGTLEVFSSVEIDAILQHVDKNRKLSLRDKLIVYFLVYTGVRASELINIKLRDLDFTTNYLTVRHGKGGKVREIPLQKILVDNINKYINNERKKHKFSYSDYLLLSERNPNIDRSVLNYALNKIAKELSLVIFPHKFRHSFATTLIRKGVNITIVSALLGHSSIETTVSFYLSISNQEKTDAINLL